MNTALAGVNIIVIFVYICKLWSAEAPGCTSDFDNITMKKISRIELLTDTRRLGKL